MENNDELFGGNSNAPWLLLSGLLIGGMAGAAAMLLLAPQSGKSTRNQITRETGKLRHRVSESMMDVVEQARASSNKVSTEVQERAGKLKHQGQETIVQQLDRVSDAVDAGKAAVKAA